MCQWHVGSMYLNGRGVDVDYKQARAWIEKAAAQDDRDAICQLGAMYLEGHGVDVDYKQARALFEKAAAQDNTTALGQLGNVYFEGWGVTPSWHRAREYFERAIELGDSRGVTKFQTFTKDIQEVTGRQSNHSAP